MHHFTFAGIPSYVGYGLLIVNYTPSMPHKQTIRVKTIAWLINQFSHCRYYVSTTVQQVQCVYIQ